MPLYEYTCKDCENTFEALVFSGEKVSCPQCQGKRLQRLLSVPGPPQTAATNLPTSCGDPRLPPCGSPGCPRMGGG